MKVKINSKLSKSVRIGIYIASLIKIFRGLFRGLFFKNIKFPFFVGYKVKITQKKNMIISKNVKFEDYCEIQGLSSEPLIFKDGVTVGRFTMIRPSSYYGVGKIGKGLEIGKSSSIGPFGYIGCAGKIIIGDNVMIGPKVSLFAENHIFEDKNKNIKKQGVFSKGIIIEDNCWIGSGVIILDGVTIGRGSVVGAGCIVTKNLPENCIVYDNRDKKMKER
ncbi:MAG: acyltransferase [Liquorilactobacillus hordei]|uniref:acyltransferase n=1 Tax=Liquorilactobacillus hordei TaxID=468911 RepID=UPI0039E80D82